VHGQGSHQRRRGLRQSNPEHIDLLVPISSLHPEVGDVDIVLGNRDIGVFHTCRFRGWTVPIRAGLLLPSAPNSTKSRVGAAAGHRRITDAATTFPRALGLRLSASPDWRPAGCSSWRISTWRISAWTTGRMFGGRGDLSGGFRHSLGVSLAVLAGRFEPYIAFVTPLDEGLRGEIYVVSTGLRLAIPR
jgi:hypothetical protein